MTIQSLTQRIGIAGKDFVLVPRDDLHRHAEVCVEAGAPLMFMYATEEANGFVVHVVFSAEDGFLTLKAELPRDDPTYPSLTRSIMAAHWYERLMHDQFGIVAEGHPDWRRLIHHENIPEGTHPLRKDFAWNTKLPHANVPYPMHAVTGKGIYEVPVGPIHAGIIEPGHFRFNVRGERILTLEGKLFFKHKGVEKLVEGKTPEEAFPFIERISGDMVAGHALAFAEAVEAASGVAISARAKHLRVLWSELERATAHVFDMGNMGGNGTGFTFMAAQGFRMVEDMRRLYQSLVGHRFLRGAIVLGGAHDISEGDVEKIRAVIDDIERDMKKVLAIAYGSDGLMERFETTGILSLEAAKAYGARGTPARASGVTLDIRTGHPYAAYKELGVSVVTEKGGDVAARFKVRDRELTESFRLIREVLRTLPKGEAKTNSNFKQGSALGAVESWRGAIIDWVRLDAEGRIDRCAISDPSFCNWSLFGELAPGNIVPDFPLCNKSLNLSYSGTDL
ncbi:MAG: putative formate hydrogenlyase large subunit [Parcubacteria group bacterium Gr01-1014_8]|nr:MAG: putative formate hydrogenlyase large subunit [Parcubacteria group bacterium Gr01-1014_8]